MAVNGMAGELVHHVRYIPSEFLGQNSVSCLHTLKPKKLLVKEPRFSSAGMQWRYSHSRNVHPFVRLSNISLVNLLTYPDTERVLLALMLGSRRRFGVNGLV